MWATRWDSLARRYVERIERDERLAESDTGAGWKWALTKFRIRRARARVSYIYMIDFRGLLIVIMAGLSILLRDTPSDRGHHLFLTGSHGLRPSSSTSGMG